MSMISVSDVVLSRGDKMIIKASSFDIERGKITVVLGPNGVGKSTLLLALAGLFKAESGSILLEDGSLDSFTHQQLAEKIAWQGALPPSEFGLKVRDRLELAMRKGLYSYQNICHRLDIEHLQERDLGELSSGERQRVELAAVVLRNTDILLLDEPVSHLDLKHQVSFLSLIRDLAEAGKSVVVVLHDVQQAAVIADDVLMIFDDGSIEYGTAESVITAARLSELFDTEISESGDGSRRLMMPDYFSNNLRERS